MKTEKKYAHPTSNDLSRVDVLLREISNECPKEAPARLRGRIEAEIERKLSFKPPLFPLWWPRIAGFAAAVLAIAMILKINDMLNRSAEEEFSSTFTVTPDKKSPQPVATTKEPVKVVANNRAQPAKKHPHSVVAPPQQAFVPLPFSDPALANGTNVTVRMTLSDAELLALGVAPDENKRQQVYVADVVLGDDGLPRAIRVLPNLSGVQGGS